MNSRNSCIKEAMGEEEGKGNNTEQRPGTENEERWHVKSR